ncbi:MAG: hypothetical protein HC915_06710 [Anaerolineae bacterium]|nr:hypothetical protein [Anaerolineae bacterium]
MSLNLWVSGEIEEQQSPQVTPPATESTSDQPNLLNRALQNLSQFLGLRHDESDDAPQAQR